MIIAKVIDHTNKEINITATLEKSCDAKRLNNGILFRSNHRIKPVMI
ncbi:MULTISPECIES: hypothetical protein [Bacillus cereus group]|nr:MULTISPECIES: hypothetical protein [Bacillus cereus group]MDR4985922.1 hypothetical protein [Bacillus cereus]MEA1011873.1 hypothetical protein [Bacillus cereus]